MYSLATRVTLAALTIASAASIAPMSPLVSTMPSASDEAISVGLSRTDCSRIAWYHPSPMTLAFSRRLLLLVLPLTALACGRTPDTEAPVATPTVTLSRTDAAIGSPVDMHYHFAVAPGAPAFTEN